MRTPASVAQIVIRRISAVLVLFLFADAVQASYGIYVGRNCTADGSVFLAGYGDEPSSHWLEMVPRREHSAGATIKVGATRQARYAGELIEIPQARVTAKYITMNYSAFAGFPAPLTNGGLNEHHVAARDVWSPSREELRRMTPDPQRGLNYSDLSRIAMERATSAREAARIVGDLIDQYGYATYGGNSHLFADAQEGWVLINFAGGKGLWVAQRLGPDEIRVSRPGYIGEIPADYRTHADYMGSPHLISFAVERGWFDPDANEPFNVNKVYGDGQFRHELVELIEQRLGKLRGKITLTDVMAAVRSPEVTRESAGYGQVAQLKPGVRPELGRLWVAPASPLTAPFVPWFLGGDEVPPEFARHRYLTEDEAAKFQDSEHRGLESTQYAFHVFKRLFYLVDEHRQEFLPPVTASLIGFESRLIAEQQIVTETAEVLWQQSRQDLAVRYLNFYSSTRAAESLRLGQELSAGIEAQTKARFGIRRPASK
jgi:dipeptidase